MPDRILPTGATVANNYRVEGHLGSGGMGTVYLAHNLTLEQRVVVKVLQGETRGAGHEEARTLASLQHPSVVQVFAYDAGLDSIVMEYLDGTSLAAWLREELEAGRMLDPVQCIRVALRMAEALAAVHGRGLVHRDIKPANVMMGFAPGRGKQLEWVKLIDFGLALKVGRIPVIAQGTPEYAAPEMFQLTTMPTAMAATSASDVYALGMTLFELLTGSVPFVGQPEKIAAAQLSETPPGLVFTLERQGNLPTELRIQELLSALGELIQEMLHKDWSKRPDALRVASRLERIERQFSEAGTFIGRAPADIGVARKTTTTQLSIVGPAAANYPPPPSTKKALVAAGIQQGPSRRAIGAAIALLLTLLAVWFWWPKGGEPSAVVFDSGMPMIAALPLVDSGPVLAEVAPFDAGITLPAVAVAVQVEKAIDAGQEFALAPVPTKVTVVAVKVPCTFDDRFREFMRRKRAEVVTEAQQQNLSGDKRVVNLLDSLDDAMETRDCAKAGHARMALWQALGLREE